MYRIEGSDLGVAVVSRSIVRGEEWPSSFEPLIMEGALIVFSLRGLIYSLLFV